MVVLKLYELSVNQESISFQTKSELINLWLSTTRFYLQNNGFEVTGIKLLNKTRVNCYYSNNLSSQDGGENYVLNFLQQEGLRSTQKYTGKKCCKLEYRGKVKHELRVMSSDIQVTSSNPRVRSSNPRITSSNPRVTSSDPRVTSSVPRVRRLKARVARLKARVGRLKARVRRLKSQAEAIKTPD